MEWEITQGVRLFRLIDRMRRAWTTITPCAELSKSQFGTLMALAYLGGRPGTDGTPPQAQGLPLTQLAHVMHQSPPSASALPCWRQWDMCSAPKTRRTGA